MWRFYTTTFKYPVNSIMAPAAIVLADAAMLPLVLGKDATFEGLGDGLVEDAGDGLVEDAGDGLVDDAHPQYNEDELPLTNALLFAFTPPEGQLVAALA
jgi:hypothetical protein